MLVQTETHPTQEMNISSPTRIAIGKRCVGPGYPALVIAEIGNNHNGDFERANALIATISTTGKPLIVSTGMSTTDEIRTTAAYLAKRKAHFVLLHCQSTYPAALHNIHLRFMETLRFIHPLVGYSGHERGTAVTI